MSSYETFPGLSRGFSREDLAAVTNAGYDAGSRALGQLLTANAPQDAMQAGYTMLFFLLRAGLLKASLLVPAEVGLKGKRFVAYKSELYRNLGSLSAMIDLVENGDWTATKEELPILATIIYDEAMGEHSDRHRFYSILGWSGDQFPDENKPMSETEHRGWFEGRMTEKVELIPDKTAWRPDSEATLRLLFEPLR